MVSWKVPAGSSIRAPPEASASMTAARSVQLSSSADSHTPSPGAASGASTVSSTVKTVAARAGATTPKAGTPETKRAARTETLVRTRQSLRRWGRGIAYSWFGDGTDPRVAPVA